MDQPVCPLCGKDARSPFPPRMIGKTFVCWRAEPGRQWIDLPPGPANIVHILMTGPQSLEKLADLSRTWSQERLATTRGRISTANQLLKVVGYAVIKEDGLYALEQTR